jgi:serine/threonine-protein kinase HipA
MKQGQVKFHDTVVGIVYQVIGDNDKDKNGYFFEYNKEYINNPVHGPISQTLPVREEPYRSEENLIPFFDGLIPEGFLLGVALKNWKLNEKDRMELLLSVCGDCIGAVSIKRIVSNESK